MSEKEEFLYPHSSSWDTSDPREIVFDANLQEFAQRVGIVCALENGGKLEPGEAYRHIKGLWKQLKRSKKALMDNPSFEEKPDLGEDPQS